MAFYAAIGQELRRARLQMKLSRTKVAAKLSEGPNATPVSWQTIKRLETETVVLNRDVFLVARLCDLYGIEWTQPLEVAQRAVMELRDSPLAVDGA